MNNEQKTILVKSVFTVFGMVAAADGVIDAKEKAVLARVLENSRYVDSSIITDVLNDFRENLVGYLELFTQQDNNPIGDISLAIMTLDLHFSPQDSDLFKAFLMQFGVGVAEASGGFMGLGDKVCEEEKAALGLIALTIHASNLR